MTKIRHPVIKLLGTIGAAAVIFAVYKLQIPCLFKAIFHVPCLSCGMTRAWLAALRLDFSTAFKMHPMFWSVPILYLYIIFDAKLFKNRIVNWTVFGLIAAGFLINYVFVLFCI